MEVFQLKSFAMQLSWLATVSYITLEWLENGMAIALTTLIKERHLFIQ